MKKYERLEKAKQEIAKNPEKYLGGKSARRIRAISSTTRRIEEIERIAPDKYFYSCIAENRLISSFYGDNIEGRMTSCIAPGLIGYLSQYAVTRLALSKATR